VKLKIDSQVSEFPIDQRESSRAIFPYCCNH